MSVNRVTGMNRRHGLLLAAKIAFATVVLLWLFHKVDVSRVMDTLRGASRGSVALGVALGLMTVAIAGWRWKRLLGIFGITVRLLPLICIVEIGQFFAIFLPGPIGDDLTRMLYISRLAPGRVGEACTTVVMDRCIGLVSVLFLALACIPWQWSVMSSSGQTQWLAISILCVGIFIAAAAAVFFAAGHPTQRWFQRRLQSRPGNTLADEAARVWGLLCDNKKTVVRLLGAAILAQFLNCGMFYLAGRAVGITMSYPVWLTFVPIVLASNALPITVAGIGVREYLLVLFLGLIAAVDSERALAASLVVFAILLCVAILGGLLYIFYKPKQKEILVPTDEFPARPT